MTSMCRLWSGRRDALTLRPRTRKLPKKMPITKLVSITVSIPTARPRRAAAARVTTGTWRTRTITEQGRFRGEVGLGPPGSCQKLPRDVGSGDAPVTMTLPSNNRNESHGKSLSGSPRCASFDRRFGWWRADFGRASKLPRSCRSANHEHRQDANLYGGRTGRSRSTRKAWTEFNIADRSSCVRTMMDFEPTYTELLTCLEMASDARKLPEELY
jgi:hypothetical protein